MVEDYSKRKLTKPQDKLPALSGLANDYNLITGYKTYLAGHWRKHFIKSLTWKVMACVAALSGDKPYRAPSWSWAPVDTNISFEKRLKSAEAKLIDFSIKLNSADPFDGILFVLATLRGKLQAAEARFKVQGRESSLYERSSNNTLGPSLYDRKFEDGDMNISPQMLYCFRLALLTMSSYHSGVLLLQPCGKSESAYRGVGYGEVSKRDFEDDGNGDEDWLRDYHIQDITVV